MNKKTNPIGIVAVILGAVVALGAGYAWGSNKSGTTAPSTTLSAVAAKANATSHNNADATFAMGMVPHHQQAIEMANLAPTRASSAKVKELAASIEAAQGPEIAKMSGWLTTWGTSGSMAGMAGMAGTMSASDMKSLSNSSGAAFDTMFLQMMVQHHQGALTMANAELKSGKNADALALAASIVVSQQGQIAQMKALLK